MTGRTRASKRGLQGDAAQRIGRRTAAASEPASETPPNTATAGAAAHPSTSPGTGRRGGILGALSAAAELPPADGERILTVEVTALAPHPDNARDDVGDVSGIGASIAERGVLQPLVVVSRSAFEAARPDVTLDPSTGWVIVAGHRRHAGAQLADVATVPVVVRDKLAGDEDAVVSMLVENLQREDLTPMEQARAFGRLRGLGWSERRIASETGVSAGQVHKRLSLLRLPEPVVAAVDASELTVTDALRLLELPDDEIAQAWEDVRRETWRGVRGVVESRLAAQQGRQHAEQLRGQLTAAGVELVDNPAAEFGPGHAEHQVGDSFTVEGVDGSTAPGAAPLPPGAVAHVTVSGARGRVTYYRRDASSPPGEPASGGSSTVHQQAADDVEQQRRAALARAEACARLVTGELGAELAAEILADTLLINRAVEPGEYAVTAAEWCGADLAALEEDLDAPGGAGVAWMAREAGTSRLRGRRAAVAVALAFFEHLLAQATPGAPDDAPQPGWAHRHIRRLVMHAGYELTGDDQRWFEPSATGDAEAGGEVSVVKQENASGGSRPAPEGSRA